ncbi:MAG: hypothetical protein KDI88_17420, partial [Gammaproteobacteria bacterium]|nr:hypothetical protein [Gammaproteobacteria bacterium]
MLAATGLTGLLLGLAACMPLGVEEQPADISLLEAHAGSDTLAFDPRNGNLLSGGWQGELNLWGAPDFRRIAGWQAHQGPVEGVAFAAGRMVSASRDGTIKVWGGPRDLLQRLDTGHPITEMAAVDDVVLVGHTDGLVAAYSVEGLRPLWRQQAHEGWVAAVAIRPDAEQFASAGADHRVIVYQRDGQMLRLPQAPGAPCSLV